MVKKLYCFVDETGQDTEGRLFVVSIVILEKDKDKFLRLCEEIEKSSGKGKFKWGRAEHKRRIQYLRQIFSDTRFKNSLYFSVFKNSKDFENATILGTAKAIHTRESLGKYSSVVYIDGLSKSKRHWYGSELRKLGIMIKKVQGVARDENNSLVRLADSVAGFVRDTMESKSKELKSLFEKGRDSKVLVEV